jgi:hypothetical protein
MNIDQLKEDVINAAKSWHYWKKDLDENNLDTEDYVLINAVEKLKEAEREFFD